MYRANLLEDVRRADEFGIEASVDGFDFERVVTESTAPYTVDAEQLESALRKQEGLTVIKGEATCVDEDTVVVGERELTADETVLATGARPFVPPIEGLADVDYLTSEDILEVDARPEHLVGGGGYVGVEFGYVFDAFGADVTVISRSEHLLPTEDPEIRRRFTDRFGERYPGRIRGHDGVLGRWYGDGHRRGERWGDPGDHGRRITDRGR